MKVVMLEVAYSCNLECKFCYNSWRTSKEKLGRNDDVLAKEDFFTIIDKLKNWGADNIGFSGGEPLINNDIFEIANYSKSQGFTNSLLTNGLLIHKYPEEIAETFDVVQISFHGTEKVHDNLTGRKGCLTQALKGRMALKDYSIPVFAATVVNKQNLSELREIIGLAASMDMSSILVNRFLPGGIGLENVDQLGLSGAEAVEMLNIIEEACDEFGIPPFVGTPIPHCIEGIKSYKFMLKEGCYAGRGIHCTVDPSGGLKVCNHSSTIIGNCLSSDPKSLYETSEYINGFKELRYTPEMCKDCSEVKKCKGGCREAAHLLYGNICAPDPIFGKTTMHGKNTRAHT